MRTVFFILLALGMISCNENRSVNVSVIKTDTVSNTDDSCDSNGLPKYLNSVKGHVEQNIIVGNFTGLGVDTIYVVEKQTDSADNIYAEYRYYAKSNNPDLPTIELFGCMQASPKLVYEGDVDGDGKDEWGYLHTWLNSQWRQYRIYNYDNKRKEWRFLYYDDGSGEESLLDTPEYVRASGVDIVEKGPEPGFIKINYGNGGVKCELRDTIVKPTYTRISADVY